MVDVPAAQVPLDSTATVSRALAGMISGAFHLKRAALAEVIGALHREPRLHLTFVEDVTMKLNRVIALFVVLLIGGLFTWAFAREHVGVQESQAIEAAAP